MATALLATTMPATTTQTPAEIYDNHESSVFGWKQPRNRWHAITSDDDPTEAEHLPYTAKPDYHGEWFFVLANLKELREGSYITQEELARVASKICGRSIWPQTIGALERKERGARRRTLEPIADALGIRARDLCRRFTGEEREQLLHQLACRFMSLPGHHCERRCDYLH